MLTRINNEQHLNENKVTCHSKSLKHLLHYLDFPGALNGNEYLHTQTCGGHPSCHVHHSMATTWNSWSPGPKSVHLYSPPGPQDTEDNPREKDGMPWHGTEQRSDILENTMGYIKISVGERGCSAVVKT